jgi:hypothetical protein
LENTRASLLIGLVFAAIALFAATALAIDKVADEAPDWCKFASKDLLTRAGKPFDCTEAPRCVKMNNYSCTKNFPHTAYEGQVVTEEGVPVTDVDHHVLYQDPKWSLLAAVNFLHRYYVGLGKHSAIEIAETWAPWCDTDGSKVIHEGWGRTCEDGPGPAPATFHGPRCEKPASEKPAPGQCGPCNCPNEIAAFYVKHLDKGPEDDLELFDGTGNPTANLKKMLPQVITYELGYVPTQTLVDQALAVYHH